MNCVNKMEENYIFICTFFHHSLKAPPPPPTKKKYPVSGHLKKMFW